MSNVPNDSLVQWAAAVGTVGGLAALLWLASRNARIRRRIRKSHGQVVSKTSRPTVKFSVRPPKK